MAVMIFGKASIIFGKASISPLAKPSIILKAASITCSILFSKVSAINVMAITMDGINSGKAFAIPVAKATTISIAASIKRERLSIIKPATVMTRYTTISINKVTFEVIASIKPVSNVSAPSNKGGNNVGSKTTRTLTSSVSMLDTIMITSGKYSLSLLIPFIKKDDIFSPMAEISPS